MSMASCRSSGGPKARYHTSYCPDLDARNRSPGGRLYNLINPAQLVAILSRAGFEKVSEERHGNSTRTR